MKWPWCAAPATPMPCARPITTKRSMPGSGPPSPDGAAIFEAAEQARVEAIGALAMEGVRQNLAAAAGTAAGAPRAWPGAAAREEAPLADVVGLMVRETLTGEKPPPPARAAVDLWRPFIEERAGKDLAKLARRDARPEGLRPAHPHHPQRSGDGRGQRSGRRRRMPKAKAPRTRTKARNRNASQDGESAATEFAEDRRRGRRG